MEGEHQVGRKNQLTKNFMPNYRTLKKKTLWEKSLVFKGHVSLVAFMASTYMDGVE